MVSKIKSTIELIRLMKQWGRKTTRKNKKEISLMMRDKLSLWAANED